MFDGDGVVEIDDGVDGSQSLFLLEQAPVERFVGLGKLFRGQVAFLFERVAVQGDAGVRLRVWVGREGREGCRGRFLCTRVQLLLYVTLPNFDTLTSANLAT